LNEGKSDTISLWNGNSGGLSITNNDNVTLSGREGVTLGILDMADLERTWMLFDRGEGTNSTDVVSSDKHNGGTNLEFNDSSDGLVFEIVLD